MESTFNRIQNRSSSVSSMPIEMFITDTKVKRNAICDEWPNYFTKNKNIVIINQRGQMKLKKDADAIFM
jgi:hypothetical protein